LYLLQPQVHIMKSVWLAVGGCHLLEHNSHKLCSLGTNHRLLFQQFL